MNVYAGLVKVELIWFRECPNHEQARSLLRDVLRQWQVEDPVEDIDATDAEIAAAVRSPGSPTIRVDGQDIEPGFVDPGDYTPRCRVYLTDAGLRGVPERAWIEDAVKHALA